MSYCRFTFAENTINISPKVPRANFQGSDGLCFINICNFCSLGTLLQKSIACLNVTLQKIYSTGTNKKNDFYQL